jgi:hypothetical protein
MEFLERGANVNAKNYCAAVRLQMRPFDGKGHVCGCRVHSFMTMPGPVL